MPSVLTRAEVSTILSNFKRGTSQELLAHLLYGCGLRLTEALNLRIKDIDFGQNIITVRDAKGGKDRTVPLPKLLVQPLKFQISKAKIPTYLLLRSKNGSSRAKFRKQIFVSSPLTALSKCISMR
jgi:integrase